MKNEIESQAELIRAASPILNEPLQGRYGPITLPKNSAELTRILDRMEDTGMEGGEPGPLAEVERQLNEVRKNWQYKCKLDPRMATQEDQPEGSCREAIIKFSARKKVIEEEIENLKQRIESARKWEAENDTHDKQYLINKNKWTGNYTTRLEDPQDSRSQRLYNTVDHRKVIYKDGVAVFEDNPDEEIIPYLDECKARKIARDKAKREAARREEKIREAADKAAKEAAAAALGLSG